MSELCFAASTKSQFHQSLAIKAEIILDHEVFSYYHLTLKGQFLANDFMCLFM